MDTNFIVRNGLSVNSAFTVNSSSLSYISNVATIGTSLYVVSNGNVGIGSTSPGANLVVQNTSGTSIPSLGSSGGHFQIQNGT